jgi:arsenate reductase
MSEVKMYHNPRCSKSRKTLELLQNKGIEPVIVEYLTTPLTTDELISVFKALSKKPKEVIRTKEDIYKELTVDWDDDTATVKAIIENPKLLERPIVIKGNKAVIGRPPENIEELF